MKIKPNQYAQALYETTKDKSQGEVTAVIPNFLEVLKRNNHLKLKDIIIKKFKEIYNRENGIVEAEVVSRGKLGSDVSKKLLTYVSKKYGAKEVILKERIDESIKGGVIIKVGNEITDASIRRQILELKNVLKNN